MDYKQFCEDAEIVYNISVTVNNEVAFETYYLSENSMIEDLRKVDRAINEKLTEQFEDLPENIEED